MKTSNEKYSVIFFSILIFTLLVETFTVYFSDVPGLADFQYLLTGLSLFLTYFSLLMIIALVIKNNLARYLIVSLILLILNIYFYLNYMYISYFGEGLSVESIISAFRASDASVAGDNSSDQILYILKIVLSHVGIHVVLNTLFKFFPYKIKILRLKVLTTPRLIMFFTILFLTGSFGFIFCAEKFRAKSPVYESFIKGTPFIFRSFIHSKKTLFPDKCIKSNEFLDTRSGLSEIKRMHESFKPLISKNLLKPDVTFLVVEGFRSDMLTKEVTPNLYEFIKEENVHKLEKLFSTGTSSTSGIHGLLSGLSDFYFPKARVISYQPLPIKLLNELDYEVNAWRSYNSKYDDYYKYFEEGFNNFSTTSVTGDHKSVYQNNMNYLNDDRLMEQFLNHLQNREKSSSPIFNFFLWFGSHYNYFYPSEFSKFKPDRVSKLRIQSTGFKYRRTDVNKGDFKKVTLEESLKNRYKNSLVYFDHQVKPLLNIVKRNKNHILVILGDHGEEFWEKGRFGHVFGLNRYQTQVAGLIKIDREGIFGDRLSTLADIFPTILDYMGLEPSLSSGISLFDQEGQNRIISQTGPFNRENYDHVILTSTEKIVINSSAECLKIKKITDYNDNEIKSPSFKNLKKSILNTKKGILINK